MIALRSYLLPGLLSALLLWLPLPYGSATPGGLLLARLSVLVVAAVAVLRERARPVSAGVRIAVGAIAGLACWGTFQVLPLPRGLVQLISPGHLELGARHPASGSIHLSLAPAATWSTLITLACVGIAIWIASGWVDRKGRRWLAVSVISAAIAQVVWGLKAWISGAATRLHGTFVNADHLAVYLEIALCVCFAACAWAFRWARSEPSLERRMLALAAPLGAWFILFAGLLLTGSRAGIVALACGLVLQTSLLPGVLRSRRARLLAVLPLLTALTAFAFIGLQKSLGRWLETSWSEVGWSQRIEVWKAAVGLLELFPLTGTGLGSFAQAFPLVQPTELAGGRWTHAHNDPLEVVLTGGPLAGLALVVGLLGISYSLMKVTRRGWRTEDRVAGLAALGAMVSVGLHEIVDFGLVLPANGFTLAVLLGAAGGARVVPGATRNFGSLRRLFRAASRDPG